MTFPKLPVIGIFTIGILGFLGSILPSIITRHFPKRDLLNTVPFRFFNGFAAGIVLAVGYIHSLPDAVASFGEVLTRDTPTEQYAWGGLLAMVGSLLTFFAEEVVHRNMGSGKHLGNLHHHHGHHHTPGQSHGHKHGHKHHHQKDKKSEFTDLPTVNTDAPAIDTNSLTIVTVNDTTNNNSDVPSAQTANDINSTDDIVPAEEDKSLGYYTELYTLLFGLSFHSLFVGLSLGVVQDDWTLFTAILIHQLFEGFALGARVVRAQFRRRLHVLLLDVVFASAAPVGIMIGIGIHSAIQDDARTFGIVNGIFQALSAGVLIYVSLVHMMKEEMEREEFASGGKLMWAMYSGFIVGSGAMAVIGIWA